MDAKARSNIAEILQARRPALVDAWLTVVGRTTYTLASEQQLRNTLLALLDQFVDVLLTPTYDARRSHDMGDLLARLHLARPEALGHSVHFLYSGLAEHVPERSLVALQERIIKVFGDVAVGYAQRTQTKVLEEQERIRSALLTDLQRSEQARHEHQARFQTIFEGAAIGIALVDMAGSIVESNAALHTMLGFSGAELRGRSFRDVTYPDDVAADVALFGELVAGKRTSYQLEKRYLRKDTNIMWGNLTVSCLCDGDRDTQFVIGMLEDVTDRKQVEQDLDAAHRQLADSQEAERLRLARDLHDDALQQLLAVIYQLGASQRQTTSPQARALGTDTGQSLIQPNLIQHQLLEITAQLRNLIGELRPPLLDEFGLTAGIESLVERLRHEQTEQVPPITLQLDECGLNLPQPVVLGLYRITQEGLRNAIKHAAATDITVTLRLLPADIVLTIQDNGRGFRVPSPLSSLTTEHHFGLVGIAERVAWLGGHLTIRSSLGAGTELTVRIPRDEGKTAHG